MLLKFSEHDMLNTELIDASTGQRVYTILSRATYIRGNNSAIVDVASRTTTISNKLGKVIATIIWTGNEKRSAGLIQILDSQPVKFTELFDGCDTVKDVPEHLVVPSRLGYDWVATRSSLFACDPDTKKPICKYWERCVHVGSTVAPSPIPSVGRDYLELSVHSEEDVVELLVGYIFMNIMRRTRFDLPKYEFPLLGESEQAKQSVPELLRQIRSSLKRRPSLRSDRSSTTWQRADTSHVSCNA